MVVVTSLPRRRRPFLKKIVDTGFELLCNQSITYRDFSQTGQAFPLVNGRSGLAPPVTTDDLILHPQPRQYARDI